MKVVLACNDDHANVAYGIQECLGRVKVEAKAFTRRPHPFNYINQAEIIKGNNLRNYAETANIVVFVHSEYLDIGVSLQGKKIYVMHTGTTYRQNSKIVNVIFNPIITAAFCGGDVLGMGAKNEIWSQPTIDVEVIKPFRTTVDDKLIFGHFPRGNKSTDKIINIFNQLQEKYDFEFRHNKNLVPWENQLKRIGECDIYIETVESNQKGVPLKIFGVTSLEAACLGIIPISRFMLKDEYEKQFGKCGLITVNNEVELKDKLEWLLTLPKEEIIRLKQEARDWIVSCHSYEVMGRRYKEIFEWEDKKNG